MSPQFRLPLLALLAVGSPAAAQRTPQVWERLGALPIDESSGVAASRRYPGILWTHNDSGDEPRLYAVRYTGELVARYDVLGARAVDWEDMALGPCPWNLAVTCLVVGDIGDNQERRTRVILYFVEEPDPTSVADPDTGIPLGPARAVRVRYADRPHDAEGLTIGPDGAVSIITKGRTGPIVRYQIPAAGLLAASVVAAPLDTLAISPQLLCGRLVTGAAVSVDGSRAVVRTYTEIYFFATDGARWQSAEPTCSFGLREAQGEAIDFLEDGSMVLTSERAGGDPAIHRIRC
jgi:hypothetical protein